VYNIIDDNYNVEGDKMDENNKVELKNEIESEDNKKETPLSVRVDSYYKDLFLEYSEQPGFSRKRLMENMISTYISRGKEENRQSNLNLEHEISLIAGSLEDILKTFKTISAKAQDTIGSNKNLHHQQMENLRKNQETLELKLEGFEKEGKELKLHNKELQLNIKNLEEENVKLKDRTVLLQREAKEAKEAHAAILNEVYTLRRIDGENIKLLAQNKELSAKIEELNKIIDRKHKDAEELSYDYEMLELKKSKEIEKLQSEVEGLSNQIKATQNDRHEELKELETMIRREIQLQKEAEILELKLKYNDLQMKYIEDIGFSKR
jgi:chromosome segregation ATPase